MALSIFCSYLIALLVMNSINFMISLNMIFKNNYSHKTLYKYSISVVIIASINYALVSYFSIKFPELYLLIIFLVTTLLFFVKFFVYDKYVFTHKKVKLEEDIF
jgi:membrane protein YdbS with pleckstrin-like domain